jgi:hypothetical protein
VVDIPGDFEFAGHETEKIVLRGSTGTTFTTGMPRLVTMIGSPVAWTSLMIERHRLEDAGSSVSWCPPYAYGHSSMTI